MTVAHRRIRLDALLVERGLASSRAKAQAAILAGEVYVNGVRAAKAGMTVADDAAVELRPSRPAFASRGGLKLDHALREFGIAPDGLVAVDVGASTGGFTDCLLQRGASRVAAIDVGTGQLDWRLRNDPRVRSLEQHDVRDVTADDLGGLADLATVDVSFISLGKILPAVRRLLKPSGTAVVLVKPQFEAGSKQLKRGVVREAAVHRRVLGDVIETARSGGWSVLRATPSPVAGPEGNLEFFLLLKNVRGESIEIDVESMVAQAHDTVLGAARR
ncbi:MAG: TlyA family RNA methyltransferase [Armatimonadetes bacterium]|nr:TlyA family RNA methyltransferase [Armatimonadota bacterium]